MHSETETKKRKATETKYVYLNTLSFEYTDDEASFSFVDNAIPDKNIPIL